LLGIEISPPSTNTAYRLTDARSRFYSVAQIRYSSSTLAPKNLFNRTLVLNFNAGGVLTNFFDSVGNGAYIYVTGTNTYTGFSSYNWFQQPYRGDILPIAFTGLPSMNLRLNFSGVGGGFFNGTAYPTNPVSGVFNLN
jgi:hypothetical protein